METLSLEDYFSSIPGSYKRRAIEIMFQDCAHLIDFIKSRSPANPGPPEMLILGVDKFMAESVFNAIRLSRGFVERCLDFEHPPYAALIGEIKVSDKLLGPNFLFNFTVAHEYHHQIRKHGDPLMLNCQFDPRNVQISRALELDADLCATASIYRHAQSGIGSGFSDLVLRKTILVGLFYVLRPLFDEEQAIQDNADQPTEHPNWAVRLLGIVMKLAHLNIDSRRPDLEFSTNSARATLKDLVDCFIRCEKFYGGGAFSSKASSKAFRDAAQQFCREQLNSDSNIMQHWESVRHRVAIVSGTKT